MSCIFFFFAYPIDKTWKAITSIGENVKRNTYQFNILSCKHLRLVHWRGPWCWERLKASGEGDDRGWNSWMASLTRWTWVRDGQGSLACFSPWGCKKLDTTEQLNWTGLKTCSGWFQQNPDWKCKVGASGWLSLIYKCELQF